MSETSAFSSMGRTTRRQLGRTVAGLSRWRALFRGLAIVRGRNLKTEKLNIAIIGRPAVAAAANLGGVAGENIVALCDVFDPAVEHAALSHPGARRFRDFRKLYDNAGLFDAVVVSTAEHTHAFATLPAASARQACLLARSR